jgi:hypothetical protein
LAKLIAVWVSACLWAIGLPMVPALAAEPASAAGPRAAIVPLSIEGELSDADRATLTDAFVDGLQRGDFEIVTPQAVQAVDARAESCDDAKCFKRIAAATKATHVVRARVVVEDRDFDVFIELYDGKSGASLARTTEGCEICGIADAANLVDTGAATLRTKLDALAKGPSTLTVKSTPEGAEVRIDGEIVGVTPIERPVIPGKRVLRITKEGYIAVEREVTFVEGVSEQLSFELDKVPSRLPPRPWGWVSLSVGLAGVATAVAFAVLGGTNQNYTLGGKCDRNDRAEYDPATGQCQRIWNTEWHALGFGLAGGALTTLGIAVLLNTRAGRGDRGDNKRRRAKKKKASAKLRFGPGSLHLRGRF